MTGALFETEKITRRKGCTDLVPLDPNVCHHCGLVLVVVEATQPALFWSHGYGEAKRGVVHVCFACGWVGNHRQESTNPRHLDRSPRTRFTTWSAS